MANPQWHCNAECLLTFVETIWIELISQQLCLISSFPTFDPVVETISTQGEVGVQALARVGHLFTFFPKQDRYIANLLGRFWRKSLRQQHLLTYLSTN